MPDPLEVLKNVKVMKVGNDVYIGVVVPEMGCCSSKVDPEDQEMFLAWKAERDAAVEST